MDEKELQMEDVQLPETDDQDMLQDFDLAVRSGSITCKSGSPRKKQFRRFHPRRAGNEPQKTETPR